MPAQESVRQLESGVARFCAWAALLGAFVLSWQTWVGIGQIAEYGDVRYALPVCVDGYMVTVLMAWIMPVSEKARRFARWNVYLASGLSVLTQSAYHGALVYSDTEKPWKAVIAWMAGALPPLFAALSVHFRTAVRYEEPLTGRSPSTAVPPASESTPERREPILTGPPTSSLSPPETEPVALPAVSLPAQLNAMPVRPRVERRIMPTKASRQRRPGPVRLGSEAAKRKAKAFAFFRSDPGMSSIRIAAETGVSDRQVRRYREEYDEMEKRRREAS